MNTDVRLMRYEGTLKYCRVILGTWFIMELLPHLHLLTCTSQQRPLCPRSRFKTVGRVFVNTNVGSKLDAGRMDSPWTG